MAPMGESVYFPPLDKCLEGDVQILSWKTTFTGLVENTLGRRSDALKNHLTDPQTILVLCEYLTPFSAPTPKSRAAFETLTSAINITPTNRGEYDIGQIKKDTLWLSKEVSIDEVAALRIAVLEWQSRPAIRLLQSHVEESQVLGDLAGNTSSLRISRSTFSSTTRAGKVTIAEDFETLRSCQLRLLDLYFSERQYLSKVSHYIVSNSVYKLPSTWRDDRNTTGDTANVEDVWLDDIGSALLKSWNLSEKSPNLGNYWLNDAVDILSKKTDEISNRKGPLHSQEDLEDMEGARTKTLVLEMIHIMQMVSTLIEYSPRLTRSTVVVSWFRFVGTYRFFEQLELPYPQVNDTIAFQSLVSLISVAILKIPQALADLHEMSTSGTQVAEFSDVAPYLANPAHFQEITDSIMQSAREASSIGSLAIFAWGMILQHVRHYAGLSRETREERQSERAVDSYGAPQPTDNDGNEDGEGWIGQRRSSSGRRSSIGSDTSLQPSFLEELYEGVQKSFMNGDIVSLLTGTALETIHVFDCIAQLACGFCTPVGSEYFGKAGLRMRLVLLDLLRPAWDLHPYTPEIMEATLAVLQGGESHWDLIKRPSLVHAVSPASVFLSDQFLLARVFDVALTQFPLYAIPFLRLCRSLSIPQHFINDGQLSIAVRLQSLNTFTSRLSEEETGYQLCNQGDWDIELTETLDLLPRSDLLLSRKQRLLTFQKSAVSKGIRGFELPVGTLGRSLNETKPITVLWDWTYSGLQYIGILLQRSSSGSDEANEVIIEIIGLLTAMLNSKNSGDGSRSASGDKSEKARLVLEEVSDGLDRNEDVVSLIFTLFESELHKSRFGPGEEGSIDILVQCVEFMHALLAVVPGRVWPFLGKSALLGPEGRESRLTAVVTSAEVPGGRFQFLVGCIRVFDAAVEDALAHVIARKKTTNISTRFGASGPTLPGTSITQNVMKDTLLQMQRILIDVFESCRNWKFILSDERLEINILITNLFNKVLIYCFAIDDSTDIASKITGFLAPASGYLVDVFLSRSANGLPLQPIFHMFLEGAVTPVDTLLIKSSYRLILQTQAALNLSTTFVRLNKYLGHTSTLLEQQLFKATPVFTKLYAAHYSYRIPVLKLLEALVCGAGNSAVQPPSLLGHLGQATAKSFTQMLLRLSQPFGSSELSISVWKFLSAVVSQRQHWFAIYLLTGDTPKESLRSKDQRKDDKHHHIRPILSLATQRLADIEKMKPREAVAMLEFVALAADFWPWVVADLRKDTTLTTAFMDFLANLQSPAAGRSPAATSFDPNQIQMASHVVDILAMFAHHGRQSGDTALPKQMLPHLTYLIEHGVDRPTYNASLHSSLRRNFENRFSGCNVLIFKRTSLERAGLGQDFYYDMKIAAKTQDFDLSWLGKGGQGFASEFWRANNNLSVVEAQINLFHSWKFLVVELSLAFDNDKTFTRSLAAVTRNCLRSNLEDTLPEAIFKKLDQSRADLAFVILQRVSEGSPRSEDIQSILKITWDTLRSVESDLGVALTSDGAEYSRTLLRVLYLALQIYAREMSKGPSGPATDLHESKVLASIQVVLEILSVVVARGFRSLTTILHDDVSKVVPMDFMLINAILRTCLHIPGIDGHSEQLMAMFTDDNTARYASTLLSWAAELTIDNDPIFGEISMTFLLELSNISALAESIAVNGISTQITAANILNFLRRPGGIGPFDVPRRIYSIWTRGILPFAMNLLQAVGAPVASEMGNFLNQFTGQLTRASTNFDIKPSPSVQDPTAGYITLSMASEAQSLAALVNILDIFREAGASAGIVAADVPELAWDKAQVKADIDSWLRRRNALRDNILATSEKEEGWARQKPVSTQSGAQDLLEEKVVEELTAALSILGDGE